MRAFCLYGETTGETDEFGLPVRYPWANEYRGKAMVVYGHTPDAGAGVDQQHAVPRHRLRLRRLADRAALSGEGARLGPGGAGVLRAREAVSTPPVPQREPDLLDLTDVTGRRAIETGYHGRLTVREEKPPPRWR